MMKKLLLSCSVLIAILLAILLFNFFSVRTVQVQVTPVELPKIGANAVTRLSAAIRLRTVSGEFDPDNFLVFLQQQFPAVYAHLHSKVINRGGLVLHWPGRAATQKPVLFLAHYDVVGAEDTGWTHAPFSGHIDSEYIWGRGSMDDKLSVLAMLEAMELLVAQGFAPQRDLYFAFGHDEEIGGEQGAAHIASYFAQQGLQFEYVLDEGMLITDGILPFVAQPVALIGVAEKGYADIELSVTGMGGHASMPGQHTLLGELSTAISRVQAAPMPARLTSTTKQMLTALAAESDAMSRLVFSNLWLFEPLLINKFEQSASTHAAIHNTFAPTQMMASDKINVLPDKVSAGINVRILPDTTIEQIVAHIRAVVKNDRVVIRVLQASEPSDVSSASAWGYRQIQQTIREVYADAVVAPTLVIPVTDSRHYRTVALQTYRFLPITVKQPDLARFHGHDERIGLQAYQDAIRFYYQCMKNSARGE